MLNFAADLQPKTLLREKYLRNNCFFIYYSYMPEQNKELLSKPTYKKPEKNNKFGLITYQIIGKKNERKNQVEDSVYFWEDILVQANKCKK